MRHTSPDCSLGGWQALCLVSARVRNPRPPRGGGRFGTVLLACQKRPQNSIYPMDQFFRLIYTHTKKLGTDNCPALLNEAQHGNIAARRLG